MRTAAAVEELFQRISGETADVAVGVLEAGAPAARHGRPGPRGTLCGRAERMALLVAPTASQAGTLQIVARSVETTLHKLLDLNFDLDRIVSGAGRRRCLRWPRAIWPASGARMMPFFTEPR